MVKPSDKMYRMIPGGFLPSWKIPFSNGCCHYIHGRQNPPMECNRYTSTSTATTTTEHLLASTSLSSTIYRCRLQKLALPCTIYSSQICIIVGVAEGPFRVWNGRITGRGNNFRNHPLKTNFRAYSEDHFYQVNTIVPVLIW